MVYFRLPAHRQSGSADFEAPMGQAARAELFTEALFGRARAARRIQDRQPVMDVEIRGAASSWMQAQHAATYARRFD
jgi:hypothetical protein